MARQVSFFEQGLSSIVELAANGNYILGEPFYEIAKLLTRSEIGTPTGGKNQGSITRSMMRSDLIEIQSILNLVRINDRTANQVNALNALVTLLQSSGERVSMTRYDVSAIVNGAHDMSRQQATLINNLSIVEGRFQAIKEGNYQSLPNLEQITNPPEAETAAVKVAAQAITSADPTLIGMPGRNLSGYLTRSDVVGIGDNCQLGVTLDLCERMDKVLKRYRTVFSIDNLYITPTTPNGSHRNPKLMNFSRLRLINDDQYGYRLNLTTTPNIYTEVAADNLPIYYVFVLNANIQPLGDANVFGEYQAAPGVYGLGAHDADHTGLLVIPTPALPNGIATALFAGATGAARSLSDVLTNIPFADFLTAYRNQVQYMMFNYVLAVYGDEIDLSNVMMREGIGNGSTVVNTALPGMDEDNYVRLTQMLYGDRSLLGVPLAKTAVTYQAQNTATVQLEGYRTAFRLFYTNILHYLLMVGRSNIVSSGVPTTLRTDAVLARV